MFEIPLKSTVPMEKATEYLSEQSKVYLDLPLIESEMASLRAQYTSRFYQLRDSMFAALGREPVDLSRNNIFEFLENSGVPERFWLKRGSKKETFDKTAKLKMIEEDQIVDFCQLHIELSSLKRYISSVESLLPNIRNNRVVEGNRGEKLVEVPYEISPIHNRRFSTSNQNIIGFYGTLKKAMKAPKGYLLIGGDFPQIDGKGALYTYFKTAKMLEIAKHTSDSYLVYKELARHVGYMRDNFNLQQALSSPNYTDTSALAKRIKDFKPEVLPFLSKGQRDIYKVIALQTVYNSSSSPFKDIDRAIKFLRTAIDPIGRYAAIRHIAEFLRGIGYPIVAKSRFGYSRPINEQNAFTMYSKLFNTPIQATSSEIILMFITHILDYFRNKGYGTDDIKVYVNRHDEPIFQIREDLFVKHVDFFRKASHILVHGWLPFEITWNVGYEYGEMIDYYNAMLKSVPYDNTRINLEAEKHLYDPEPLPMEIPEYLSLSHRILPNGKILFLMTRLLGEINADEYHFNQYRDSRKCEYALISAELATDTISRQETLSVALNMMQGLDVSKRYLLLLEDGGGSQDLALGDYSVFVSGSHHELHNLNKVILGSILLKNYPAIATHEDTRFAEYASHYSSRLVRREVQM